MKKNSNVDLGLAVDALRARLMDIGKRSTLVNAPVGKNRMKALDIEDERSDEVFKILYQRNNKMMFEAYRGASSAPANAEDDDVYIPRDDEESQETLAAHHVDKLLQTRLTDDALQKRLLNLFREASLMEEEQGVSVLFLALGFLEWYESTSSDIKRYAPLVLLPVNLERGSSRVKFKLVVRNKDLEPNLSLRAMLENDFDLSLPNLPDDEKWLPSEYFKLVEKSISSKPRWRVHSNLIELSFYSFAKFLMWNDLTPENIDSETCAGSDIFSNLLVGGFQVGGSVLKPEEKLDKRFPNPQDLVHILDADSSQTQVISAARNGKNLVVQGPPGTGKSQTIANIIASALKDKKRVLFVAEKRAALEVVYERLRQCGLGELCLELHSQKANRKYVYEQLKKTLELGQPVVDDFNYEQLRQLRDDLNQLSSILHKIDKNTEQTPFLVIGKLSELNESKCQLPDFTISGADSWSAQEYKERLDVVTTLASLTTEHGSEFENVWRGTQKRLTQFEKECLRTNIEDAVELLDSLEYLLRSAAKVASFPNASTIQDALEVTRQLNVLAARPSLTDSLVNSPELVLNLSKVSNELLRTKAELLKIVNEKAFEIPWTQVRGEIEKRGKSIFRFFSGSYKKAIADLASVCQSKPPRQYKNQLALIDRLLDLNRIQQNADKSVAKARQYLKQNVGESKVQSQEINLAVEWIEQQEKQLGSHEKLRNQVLAIPPNQDLANLATELQKTYEEWRKYWRRIANETELDFEIAFGANSVELVDIEILVERLYSWLDNMSSLDSWYQLRESGKSAEELGLDELRKRIGNGELDTDWADKSFEYIRARALWKRMCEVEPKLEQIKGSERTLNIEKYKNLDQELQRLASQEIALQHFESLPTGASGQIGIVRGEVNKKIRHMQLRKLLDKAGEAVLTIKPVFMMSPLSIAQFLKLGRITFDLLLIDEASQVRPSDAMGAILRSKQIVVVGDQKQMPPTSFFDRQVGSDDLELEDESQIFAAQVAEMESILSLCEARAMSRGMLRWHYRSKHPSLIAVSNHEFYNDSLIFPPSPISSGHNIGLSFNFVENGVYGRGKQANNINEAQVVADAVLEFAKNHPNESLGVVALSKVQSQTILNKLEILRAENPELDAFCNESKTNPFFVKNLENVQGDERDTIFISIAYGKDENGYFSQNFGPVSSSGGERRLNVLFTRAKKRCQVFSSIRHSDIRVDVSKHVGPRVLRRFLKFAETGDLDIPIITGAAADSPFETAVARALQKYGFKVEGQVGSAGFLIDLAVYDPEDDGRFLLAIECDGARYHSSSWARERDRLRQVVLEQKGWKIHRIWSTDWLYNRDVEMKKLLKAIDRARMDQNGEIKSSPPPNPEVMERVEVDTEPRTSTVPYQEASLTISDNITTTTELRDASRYDLVEFLVEVVEVEGPIHIQEIARRLSLAWGYKSTGPAIRRAVEATAMWALQEKLIQYSDSSSAEFFDRIDAPELIRVRDRSNASMQIKQLKMLPPAEIQAAVIQAVEQNIALDANTCAVQVARMFGYKRSTKGFQNLVKDQIQVLMLAGKLQESNNEISLS